MGRYPGDFIKDNRRIKYCNLIYLVCQESNLNI